MRKINWVRVILGGLLAGVVINVIEFITNGVVLAADWEAAMKLAGRPTAPSGGALIVLTIWGFLMGIAAIWLYAAARPRFARLLGTAGARSRFWVSLGVE